MLEMIPWKQPNIQKEWLRDVSTANLWNIPFQLVDMIHGHVSFNPNLSSMTVTNKMRFHLVWYCGLCDNRSAL